MANLNFARMATTDKIPSKKISLIEKVLFGLHSITDVFVQTALFLLFLYLISILFILYFSLHIRFKRAVVTIGLVVTILFAVLSLSLFSKIYFENSIKEGVVLVEKVNAKNEPNGNQTLFSVHKGTKFRLSRKVDSWYLAGLENGISGWVHEDDIGLIEIP